MSEKIGGMPPAPQEKVEKPEMVWRVTKEQFDSLPDGTELMSISGKKIIKSKDFRDFDTRGGRMGYGFLEKDIPAGMILSEKDAWPIKPTIFDLPPRELPSDEVWRITKEQFDSLPDGTELMSISGEKIIKGKDFRDFDTRGGRMGYGFLAKDRPKNFDFDQDAAWKIRTYPNKTKE